MGRGQVAVGLNWRRDRYEWESILEIDLLSILSMGVCVRKHRTISFGGGIRKVCFR